MMGSKRDFFSHFVDEHQLSSEASTGEHRMHGPGYSIPRVPANASISNTSLFQGQNLREVFNQSYQSAGKNWRNVEFHEISLELEL